MAWGLAFIGLILAVATYKGNHNELFALIKRDFSGNDNFIYWVLAIIVLIAVGSIKKVRPVTDAFLILVILVIIVSNRGRGDLFADFLRQVKEGTSGRNVSFSDTTSRGRGNPVFGDYPLPHRS